MKTVNKNQVWFVVIVLLLIPLSVHAQEDIPPTPEPNGRITAPEIMGVNPDPEPLEGQLSEIEASGSIEQQTVGIPVSSEAPPLVEVAQPIEGASQSLANSLAVPMRYQDPLDVSCGVQALGMAMDFMELGSEQGAPTSEEMLRDLSSEGLLQEWGTGVDELAYLARKRGYAGSYSFYDWGLDQLMTQLDQGRPVVVSLGTNGEGEAGHFVTVTGISEDGQWVSYNDPTLGEVTVSASEFLEEWGRQGYAGMVTQREALAAEVDPMVPVMGMFGALSALTVVASQQPWRKDVVAKVTAMQDALADPERMGIGGRRRRRSRRARRPRRPRRPPRRPPRRRVVKPKPRPKPRPPRRKAQEQARRRAAQAAARRRAQEAARRKAQEAARLRAQAEARRRAEEAQRKEQMARQAALLAAQRKAEAEARRKASVEAKIKAEREARLKAAEEAAKKAKAQQEANSASQVELLRFLRNEPQQQSLADWKQQDMDSAYQQLKNRREAEAATHIELLRAQRNRPQQSLADWKQKDMVEMQKAIEMAAAQDENPLPVSSIFGSGFEIAKGVEDTVNNSNVVFNQLDDGKVGFSAPKSTREMFGFRGTYYKPSTLSISAAGRGLLRNSAKNGSVILSGLISLGTNIYDYQWGTQKDTGVVSQEFVVSTVTDTVVATGIGVIAAGIVAGVAALIGLAVATASVPVLIALGVATAVIAIGLGLYVDLELEWPKKIKNAVNNRIDEIRGE
jgi:hypothetical protein